MGCRRENDFLPLLMIDSAARIGDPSALRSLVDAAVAASEVTCYVCGAPGEMRQLGGWASVRCDAHTEPTTGQS